MSTKSKNQSTRNKRRRQKQKAKSKASKPAQPKYYNTKQLLIGDCTREYIRALVNPFGNFNMMPCIPDVLSIPSQKVEVKVRGVMSTGTSGTGYVMLNPFLPISSGLSSVLAGNDFPVIYTNQLYAQTGLLWNDSNVAIAGVTGANSNSPYNAAFWLTEGRQYRLVGAGLRIRYVGSTFRNQGRVCLIRRPGNNNIPPGTVLNVDYFLQDNINIVEPVSRASEYVHYVPDDPQFFAYHTINTFLPSQAGAQSARRSLAILIDGADASVPQSWEFEAVAFYEAIGPGLSYSPSHSDTVGMGATMASLPTTVPKKTPQAEENSLLQRFASVFDKETTRYVFGQAANAVKTGAAMGASLAGRSILHSATNAVLLGGGRNMYIA